jgi:hypothetical protein
MLREASCESSAEFIGDTSPDIFAVYSGKSYSVFTNRETADHNILNNNCCGCSKISAFDEHATAHNCRSPHQVKVMGTLSLRRDAWLA